MMVDPTDEHGFPKPQDDFSTNNPFASPLAVGPREQGYVNRSTEVLNPWFSMWTKPRVTVRQQLDTDPRQHVLLVAALWGFSSQLANQMIAQSEELPIRIATMFGWILGGAVIGMIWIFLLGWLSGMAGRILGGVANALECRCALAWCCIPGIWMGPLYLMIGLYYLVVGPDAVPGGMPRQGQPPMNPWAAFSLMPPWMFAIMVLAMIIGLWMQVLSCHALGEAHQYSSWRGLGTLLLTVLLMIGVIMAFAFVVGVLVAMFVMALR
ncbi:YIP1 family protein [Aeoliella sp. ICT_H6.2]|uniref:YIP1 family protein n=2 Tax=Aeoliella straminimaris TaxID=2954799 RepID=A0A9X2FA54_9BACT|nr:YIP1 family protein [Aeoliella straminimaris]